MAQRYAVTVFYREPTFEQRVGRQGEPYQFTFELLAGSEQAAILAATERFWDMARLSSVSWVREILRVEARPVPIGPPRPPR